MIATRQFVKDKFFEFNALCFEGALPVVPIRMSRARSYCGMLRSRVLRNKDGRRTHYDFLLLISTAFDLPEAELEDTVLHEMIHYWIYWNELTDTSAHGRLFRAKMKEINERFGRHITISHREGKSAERGKKDSACAMTDDEVASGNAPATVAGCLDGVRPGIEGNGLVAVPRPHLVCVVTMKDGTVTMAVVARTRIFMFHQAIVRARIAQTLEWYYSTEPWFDRFPSVRTVKLFKANKEELSEHLVSALPLVCDGKTMRPKQRPLSADK